MNGDAVILDRDGVNGERVNSDELNTLNFLLLPFSLLPKAGGYAVIRCPTDKKKV